MAQVTFKEWSRGRDHDEHHGGIGSDPFAEQARRHKSRERRLFALGCLSIVALAVAFVSML